jgi:hypothetical protein
LFKKLRIIGRSSVLICFIIRVNPLETFERHLTPLARLLAFKESYPIIFADLLFGISFEPGVKETVAMRLSGHRTRSVFDRYNIVSEDDLIDASKKLEAFLAEAVKESKIEKLQK